MAILETKIKGLYVIDGKHFEDIRGDLIKPYSVEFMPEGVNTDFKEVWFTKSKRDVIRGMHLQVAPFACEKAVSAIEGSVLDVILDLRDGSSTYGETFEIELSAENNKVLYIPKGCAHGYKVTADKSIVMYMGTEVNVGKCDIGIRWDSFGYDWKIDKPILSDKDLNLAPFVKGETKF